MGRAGVLRVLSEDEWTLRPTRRGRAVSLHESKRPRCPRRRRHDRARGYRLKRFKLKTENRSRNNGSGQRFIASNGDSCHPTGGGTTSALHLHLNTTPTTLPYPHWKLVLKTGNIGYWQHSLSPQIITHLH